jgi:hypothetical protein
MNALSRDRRGKRDRHEPLTNARRDDDEDDRWKPRRSLSDAPTAFEMVEETLVHLRELVQIGETQGLRRGITQGRAEALRRDIFEVIDVRGLPADPADRQRIAQEASVALLRQWHRRAITAGSVAEILAEKARPLDEKDEHRDAPTRRR